jgi:hypothetical protein
LDGNTWRENSVLLAKEQRRLVRLLFFLIFEWILQLFEIIQEMTEKKEGSRPLHALRKKNAQDHLAF